MQVEQFLEDSARRFPDKVALVCGDRRLTYRQIDERCNRLARKFMDAGVRRGDRVAIYLENSAEAVLAIFATLKAGAVFMPVNPTTKADKLALLLQDAEATAVVCHRRTAAVVASVQNRVPFVHTVLVCEGPGDITPGSGVRWLDFAWWTIQNEREPSGCIDVDLAALLYTSGSTGTPKGVMLTHLNIVSVTTSITSYLQNTENDVILNVLPLSFGYGLSQIFTAFQVGATVVLERSFMYPHAVLEKIVSERVTGLPLVPTISAILLQIHLEAYDFSRLRYITNAAAALPTRHVQELQRRLPHVLLYPMHGLTECIRVTYLPPEQVSARPDSVGRGMPNEEVFIVDEKGARLSVGVGELVVRGAHVMKGYWRRPEDTDRALRPAVLPNERLLYTGDIFRMDAEGYLYFVSRKDDIIKCRGEKVSPKEVENVLTDMDDVAEAAVVGQADEILGEAVIAFVTARNGNVLAEAGIRAQCAKRLEDFVVPKRVIILNSMPKTGNGKVAKRQLKELLQAEAGVAGRH